MTYPYAKKSSHTLLLAASFLVVSCSVSDASVSKLREAWDYENHPSHFDVTPKKFASLPLEGHLPKEHYPWSDDYWPTYGGGISRRWQVQTASRDYKTFVYKPIDESIFSTAPSPTFDIAKLSPAEKFDLYMDRYDFPLTKQEQEKMLEAVDEKTKKIPSWFGLCHGLAPASLMEPEPGPVLKVKNKKGLEIPFYPSDIKALMTYIYANAGGTDRFIGVRCQTEDHELKVDSRGRIAAPECRDVNPGAFHLVLAELLGNQDESKRRGFVFDMFMGAEVWNQAVVGYQVRHSTVDDYDPDDDPLSDVRAPGTAKIANIAIYVSYVTHAAPSFVPLSNDPTQYTEIAYYAYSLELDANGVIIGGEWKSRERPDFIWMLKEKPKGTDLLPYAKAQELLALSRDEKPPSTPAEPLPNSNAIPPSPADSAGGVGEGITPHALALPEFPLPIF